MISMWRRLRGSAEMASCRETMRVLQSYLDGQVDDVTTRRVGAHLEACRRCGLEAGTYREIKAALARRAGQIDPAAVERLRAFGETVPELEAASGDDGPARPPR